MSVDPAREYGGGIRRLEIVSLGHGSSAPKLLVLQIGNSPTLPDPTDNGRIRHFRCVGGRRHGGIASCTPARRSRLLLLPTHRKEAQGPGEDDGLFQIREVQTRVFDEPDKLAAVMSFYEALTGGRCSLRFPFPARRLELTSVSSPRASFLIIAGPPDAIAPFASTSLPFSSMTSPWSHRTIEQTVGHVHA